MDKEKYFIYLIFTNTGTYLSKVINFYTRGGLNHVSISTDEYLSEVYSFGRKKTNNPFIGGFVREDMQDTFFLNSDCSIHKVCVDESSYIDIKNMLKRMESHKDKYRYNLIGLISLVLRINWEREDAYFCSQFAAMVLTESGALQLSKPCSLVTPTDIRTQKSAVQIFTGKLRDYSANDKSNEQNKLWDPVVI